MVEDRHSRGVSGHNPAGKLIGPRPLAISTLVLLLSVSVCQAQGTATAGRPILFVHGICSEASDWTTIQTTIMTDLSASYPALYGGPQVPYTLYYDGTTVRTWPDGNIFLSRGIPANTRFFSINFYAQGSFGTDSAGAIAVAGVSVVNKADELAHVVQAITELTLVKDVIVVGHSMGGLVTRAYLQGLGSPYIAFCNDSDGYESCSPGTTKYAANVGGLVNAGHTARWRSQRQLHASRRVSCLPDNWTA